MKKISIYSFLAAVGLTFTSCSSEFLNLTPPTSLTPEQALASESDLEVALRGAYANLRHADLHGRTIPIIGDLLADNIYQSATNTNRYTQYSLYLYVLTDSDVAGLWQQSYSTILRANNIINSPIASTANVEQYKGEAHAIRALSYFNLVRYFARPYTDSPNALGVPIVLSYDPDGKPSRSTVGEVYSLIIDDLTNAYNLATGFTNSSQFSRYAAQALLAKVYLTMGDYQNARLAALDVINNGGFTPVTAETHAEYWANPAIRTDRLETLFEVSSDAVANAGFNALSYIYSQEGNYGDFLLTEDLYSLFEDDDIRKELYPLVTRQGESGLVVSVNKYPAIAGDRSDTKVIRLSEVYLIAAETSLPSNETDARTYLNFVTSRRGASAITSSGAQLLEDILTERRKELATEGDRYLDFQRLQRDVVRVTNIPPGVSATFAYDNYRRILPIPQGEVDANENIRPQQNPNY